jgi:signal-transduction protein with cAMP-binding, CBS, and nucleotidyltransferase domain
MDTRDGRGLFSGQEGRVLEGFTAKMSDQSRRRELVEALKSTRLFSSLPEETLATIAGSCSIASFKPGDEMMTEGQPGDCAYVLLEGEAVVSRSGYGLVTRRTGECLGELALLDSQRGLRPL